MTELRIGILGGGLLARAVGRFALRRQQAVGGGDMAVWVRRPEAREQLAAEMKGARVVDSPQEAAAEADLVLIAVPASAVREVCAAYGEVARGDQLVLHATRGVCPGDGLLLPHMVIREESCVRKVGVLGGPVHAPDLLEGRAMAAVIASHFDEMFAALQPLTFGTAIRIHPSHDVTGVEVAGAISNVSALAAGMVDALELGDTARGVLLTRGLAEAARLGAALGAEADTFSGLAGVGDLIPRRVASTARHHGVGSALARGETLELALTAVVGEVEGVLTAERVNAYCEHVSLELPLVQAVHEVATGARPASEALEDVLGRHLDLGKGMGGASRRA